MTSPAVESMLLRRVGLVFVPPGTDALPQRYLEALEIELAELGYALSTRLRGQLETVSLDVLTAVQHLLLETLAATSGGNQKHEPLFRRFPDGIPTDTFALWVRKVLGHFVQAEDQRCPFCGEIGTTHVLNPCRHVVCDRCFDGANYSACPICEHHVDRSAPFFQALPELPLSAERITFKRLDLGSEPEAAARSIFESFCQRKQAMSPVDKGDFTLVVREYAAETLSWLPAEIPVRENVALLFGTLLQMLPPSGVVAALRSYANTATDVLRLVAAYSGADPALQGQTVYRPRQTAELRTNPKYCKWFSSGATWFQRQATISLPSLVNRFTVAKLPRALRRALLEFLAGLQPDSLVEDMLRHRSYWVWLGEFLHPAEYRQRFPTVARAFEIIRRKAPDGVPAPSFRSYYSKLESVLSRADAAGAVDLLAQRPGEFARRLDQLLRIADEADTVERVMATLSRLAPKFSTPVLLTLQAHLRTRSRPVPARIYWPKSQVSRGIFDTDRRAVLPEPIVHRAVEAIENEVLRRFSDLPKFDCFLIDSALQDIIVPFNERTASRSAIQLPRGSTIDVATDKTIRLFLHWCQPETGGHTTDLDLSVGFYDRNWNYVGVCSYYQLQFVGAIGKTLAVSAGDLRDAPFPDGATEFVDFDRDLALAQGIRYAVAVINNYAGMPFEQLDRAYAGIMMREDVFGRHFDPRTVALKFELTGANGIFLPLVIDLVDNKVHWLDVYSRGELAFNNVASSNSSIVALCPRLIEYFASGARTSMYELALLHAAARAQFVVRRQVESTNVVRRHADEDNASFLRRLRQETGEPGAEFLAATMQPLFGALLTGNIALPEGSRSYVVIPETITGNMSASELIA